MDKNLTFEQALLALEEIVNKLEVGTLSLEESLVAYEEGIALSRFCAEKLELAKQKVSILTATEDGVITDKPFSEDFIDEN